MKTYIITYFTEFGNKGKCEILAEDGDKAREIALDEDPCICEIENIQCKDGSEC